MLTFKVKTNEGWRFVQLDGEPRSCGCDGTLAEWLTDAWEQQTGELLPEGFQWRRVNKTTKVGTRTLRLFYRMRDYGGPEEGGWYYDTVHTVREWVLPVANYQRHADRLERFCDAKNAGLPSWDGASRLRVATWEEEPRRERPHYC